MTTPEPPDLPPEFAEAWRRASEVMERPHMHNLADEQLLAALRALAAANARVRELERANPADMGERFRQERDRLAARVRELAKEKADHVARLRQRIDGIDEWLRTTGSRCKEEQRHCEEGTVERTYWHYGYMVALRDMLALTNKESDDE